MFFLVYGIRPKNTFGRVFIDLVANQIYAGVNYGQLLGAKNDNKLN